MKSNPKNFQLNSNWTANQAVKGWRHYRISRIYLEDAIKHYELMSVCDRAVLVQLKISDLKNDPNWVPGWK